MGLRTRLIASYILIVILCLGIVAAAASVIIQGYRDEIVTANLDNMTRPVYVQLRALAQGQASVNEVWTNLREQAQKNDVYIILVDGEGNSIRQASPQERPGQQSIDLPPGELPHGLSQPAHGTFVTSAEQTFIYAAYPAGRLFVSQKPSRIDTLVLAAPRSGTLGCVP